MRERKDSTLYEAFGGTPACRRLAVAFYARVEQDPILRPLFPGKSFTCAIEEFTAFLVQFLGGPGEDSQRRWWLSLRESHARFKIGPGERDAWIASMAQAFEDAQVGGPLRSELLGFFERTSAHIVNRGGVPAIDPVRSRIHDHDTHTEIARRWDAHIMLDEAVRAIRNGDAGHAIALAEDSSLQVCGRSLVSGLLALMIRSGQSALLEYVWAKLKTDPSLIKEHYAGRNLLHEAAAAGSLPTLQLLLRLGADANAKTGGRHTPLYCLANECAADGAGWVVRTLVDAGADVDAHDGVKHCTPLHMAARRGKVEVAEALLDCGANIEAPDSLGETPLRRAVNCDKTGVAALLLDRGADARSRGSKGITPLLAARSTVMKNLLRGALDMR